MHIKLVIKEQLFEYEIIHNLPIWLCTYDKIFIFNRRNDNAYLLNNVHVHRCWQVNKIAQYARAFLQCNIL
jgi:hypothetical protein